MKMRFERVSLLRNNFKKPKPTKLNKKKRILSDGFDVKSQ